MSTAKLSFFEEVKTPAGIKTKFYKRRDQRKSGGKATFLTRKHGTSAQIGSIFPVKNPLTSGMNRPKIARGPPFHGKPIQSQNPLTPLEEMATAEEKALLASGFKGWTVAVKYKDGDMENIPVTARSPEEALAKARPRMNQHNSQIDEVVIVDPSLREVLHKIGSGAVKVAKSVGKGIKKAQAFAEKTSISAARKLGRIEAFPAELKEAYGEGLKERPWKKTQKLPVKKYTSEQPRPPSPISEMEEIQETKPTKVAPEKDVGEEIVVAGPTFNRDIGKEIADKVEARIKSKIKY